MFKKVLIIVILAITTLISFAYFSSNERDGVSEKNTQIGDTIITVGGKNLTVDIADDPLEQSRGLSGREILNENEGMLFVFPISHIPSFWMKDMNFSLDMIWITEAWQIAEITKNISPDTFPKTFSPESAVKYVLEVNAGWSDRNKIRVGDKVTY